MQVKDQPHIDTIFATPAYPTSFAFDEAVAQVFDNMLQRSIPLYHEINRLVCCWGEAAWQPGARAYDVGCSTGETIARLAAALPGPGTLIGIDNSPAMIIKAREKVSALTDEKNIEFVCSEAEAIHFDPAQLVVCNFTLQFLPLSQRLPLLKRIKEALLPNGILFLSEKLKCEDPWIEEQATSFYEAFKRQQGYSQDEIDRKKQALTSVLIPSTLNDYGVWLKEAGFSSFEVVLKWHNFVAVVAR